MKKLLVPLTIMLILTAFARAEIMTFDELRKGMKGKGKTVFRGTTVEEFDVEIVGLFGNVGLNRDMILAEVSGDPLGLTGVMNGMSGSPIYIDGKLIGALAFTWPFQKKALAGVTPIEEMLDLEERIASAGPVNAERYVLEDFLNDLGEPADFAEFPPSAGEVGMFRPIAMPLVFSGFDPGFVNGLSGKLEKSGFFPIQGTAASGTTGENSLKPGSAVGVQLIRGDLEMAAFGTVTHLEGNKVYAFGHPFVSAGPVDFPMTYAAIEALMPSNYMSSKMGRSLGAAGAMTRDGSSGVMGALGKKPAMKSVRVGLSRNGEYSEHFSFDLIEHDALTPRLLSMAVTNIIQTGQKSMGYETIVLDGTIDLADHDDIMISDVYTGTNVSGIVGGLSGAYLNLLYNSGLEVPEIKGISLYLDYSDSVFAADIEDVWINKTRVKAGEGVELTMFLRPFREKAEKHKITVDIPAGLKGREVLLRLGDASSINRYDVPAGAYFPPSMDDLVRVLNNLRTNNTVYVTLSVKEPSYILGGKGLGDLPPSRGALLGSRKKGAGRRIMRRAVVDELTYETDYVIFGYHQFTLEVM